MSYKIQPKNSGIEHSLCNYRLVLDGTVYGQDFLIIKSPYDSYLQGFYLRKPEGFEIDFFSITHEEAEKVISTVNTDTIAHDPYCFTPGTVNNTMYSDAAPVKEKKTEAYEKCIFVTKQGDIIEVYKDKNAAYPDPDIHFRVVECDELMNDQF